MPENDLVPSVLHVHESRRGAAVVAALVNSDFRVKAALKVDLTIELPSTAREDVLQRASELIDSIDRNTIGGAACMMV